MKNYLISFFLIFTTLLYFKSVYAQAPESIFEILDGGGVRTWVYVGGDEFDGTALDYTKWHNSHNGERVGCNSSIVNNHYYTDGNNIDVSGGNLNLIAKNDGITARGITYQPDSYALCDGAANLRSFPYTSGMIYSNQKFRYGLFQCKFNAPAGTGLWPAFWLFGNGDEEIDCFELKGERHTDIHYDLHQYYSWTSHHTGETDPGGWLNTGVDLTGGSHVLTCIWEPGIVEWYIDNTFLTFEFVDFYNSMNIIANLGVSNGVAFAPGVDGTTPFPATFTIDYIRAYAVQECDAVSDPPICSYTTADYNDIAVVGTYIRTGVDDVYPECPAGSNITVTSGHSFKLIATDHIVIEKDFTVEEGSYFEAKILDCWEGRSAYKPEQHLNLVTPDLTSQVIKTNTEKTIETNELKIYPNPANSVVTISSNENYLIKFVKLYDVVGSLIKEFSISNESTTQINVSEIPKGFYSLEIKTQKNNYKKTLIIQ